MAVYKAKKVSWQSSIYQFLRHNIIVFLSLAAIAFFLFIGLYAVQHTTSTQGHASYVNNCVSNLRGTCVPANLCQKNGLSCDGQDGCQIGSWCALPSCIAPINATNVHFDYDKRANAYAIFVTFRNPGFSKPMSYFVNIYPVTKKAIIDSRHIKQTIHLEHKDYMQTKEVTTADQPINVLMQHPIPLSYPDGSQLYSVGVQVILSGIKPCSRPDYHAFFSPSHR